MTEIDRRMMLAGSAALAAASTLPPTEAHAGPSPILLRRNVASMAWNDPILNSYREAIMAMRALPKTDPRNWVRQAQIHQGSATVRCPHGNWYFLPWHRAYLVAFERICRQLSANPNFALPYWDWTANPQLPAQFANATLPNGKPNALFNKNRNSQTVTIPSSVAGTAVISNILAETNFEVFGSGRPAGQNNTNQQWQIAGAVSGPLESNPHNQVHVRVGGDMGTFMSPLDPIFWLHHCNIDRLWDRWNRLGRTNTANPLWRNFAFNNQFVNPSGGGSVPFNVTVNNLQNINALGYRYVPPLIITTPLLVAQQRIDLNKLPAIARLEEIPPARVNAPLNMPVKLSPSLSEAVERIGPVTVPERFNEAAPVQAKGRAIAIIRDVDPPKQGNVDVRVFVNCPYLTPETPPQDRHYAGSFTFFGFDATDHAEHGSGKPSYFIDLTETVRRLRLTDTELKNELNVQLMPVPIPGVSSSDVQFKVGSVEVAIV